MEEKKTFDHDTFANRFDQLLKERKITSYRLAQLLEKQTGIRPQTGTVSNWSKTGLPRIDNLFAIYKILHVDSDYLIGLSDDSNKVFTDISKETGLTNDSITNLRKQTTNMALFNMMLSDEYILDTIIKILEYINSDPIVTGMPINVNNNLPLSEDAIERAYIDCEICYDLYRLKQRRMKIRGEED